MWKGLVLLISLCHIALIVSTIKPVHRENGIWFPGKGCGNVNELKYLRKIPEDTSNLACTFIFADINQRGINDHFRIPKLVNIKSESGTESGSPTGNRVMLIGGTVSFGDKRDIEIIDLENSTYTCPKSDNQELRIYPDHNVLCPGGGLVPFGGGYMPFICGGETNSKGRIDKCFQLIDSQFKEDVTAKLNLVRRCGAYSIVGDNLVMAGGIGDGFMDTVDVAKPNTPARLLSSKLPVKVLSLCQITLSDSVLITVGGYTGSRIPYTYIIDIDKDQITRGPDLITGRQDLACGKILIGSKTYLVAMGGATSSERIDSTEFLDLDLLDLSDFTKDYQAEGIKWINGKYYFSLIPCIHYLNVGPKLPEATMRGMAITLAPNSIYQLGGETATDSINRNVYKLTCGSDVGSCQWKVHPISLRFGRKHHIIIPIEESLADELCGNNVAA